MNHNGSAPTAAPAGGVESHDELRSAIRSLFTTHSTLEIVRKSEPLGFDPSLWDRLRSFGIPALAVPSQFGGGGASLPELAVIAEEGRSRSRAGRPSSRPWSPPDCSPHSAISTST